MNIYSKMIVTLFIQILFISLGLNLTPKVTGTQLSKSKIYKIEGLYNNIGEIGLEDEDLLKESGNSKIDSIVQKVVSDFCKTEPLTINYFFFQDSNKMGAYAVSGCDPDHAPDGSILIGKTFAESIFGKNSTGLYILILHEIGHLYQKKLSSSLVGKAKELDADRFAGNRIRQFLPSNILSSEDSIQLAASQGIQELLQRGDKVYKEESHGSSPERVGSFLDGFRESKLPEIPCGCSNKEINEYLEYDTNLCKTIMVFSPQGRQDCFDQVTCKADKIMARCQLAELQKNCRLQLNNSREQLAEFLNSPRGRLSRVPLEEHCDFNKIFK